MPEYRDSNGNTIPAPNAQERVTRAMAPTAVMIACPKCSSTYFYTVQSEQFAGGGYGSMEFRSLSPTPVVLRICLCGQPMPPEASYAPGARTVQTARDAFHASVRDAIAYREKVTAEHVLNKVAGATASREELEALRNEIDARLTALESTRASFNAIAPKEPVQGATLVGGPDVPLPPADPSKPSTKGRSTVKGK